MNLPLFMQRLFRSAIGGRHAEAQSPSAEGLEKASAVWGQKAEETQMQLKPSSWAECPVVLAEYINPQVSNHANRGWLEAVAEDYFPRPVERALSLGCGSGGLERHGLQLGIAHFFDAFDVAEGAIKVAREEAEASGQNQSISYQTADLNRIQLEADSYAAVFASQSVHHIENLEHYMAQVHKALTSDGLFIVNEFVGPNQFQWTDAQLHHAQKFLDSIPEHLKSCIREEGVKQTVDKPTIEAMNAYDPTEAIRSEDIIPQIEARFDIIDRREFGGTLLHLVLDNIAGNLSESEEGKAILRRFFAEEKRLIESGEIQSDFVVLVARKRQGSSE
ncbi:MAG: class I SAM-dependent methyltransferase [Gammaproteobacteria bacterium]